MLSARMVFEENFGKDEAFRLFCSEVGDERAELGWHGPGRGRQRRLAGLRRVQRRDHRPALRVPCGRGRVRRRVRPHPGPGADVLGGSRQERARAINHNDGGRGLYFDDPDRHRLEIITRPYGSGG